MEQKNGFNETNEKQNDLFLENAANDKKTFNWFGFRQFLFFNGINSFFWGYFEGEVKLDYLYAYRSVCSNLLLFVVVVLI